MAVYPRNKSGSDLEYYLAPGFPIQSARSSVFQRTGFVQAPVTRTPLSFKGSCSKSPANRSYNSADVSISATQLLYNNNPYAWDMAYARAFAKFKGRIRGEADASLGVFLAELPQAYKALYHRFKQLSSALRHLRRGNVGALYRTLKVPPSARKPLNRGQSVADQWLELSFGWMPAIADIYNILKVLESTPGTRVSARGGFRPPLYNQISNGIPSRISVRMSVEMRATVRIESPYVYTLSQLGLLNPAEVVWELIPWSFLVDWFASVGAFLSNLSAFAGLRLEEASYTYFGIGYDSTAETSPLTQPPRMSKSWRVERVVGVPPVPPIGVSVPRMSSMRTANAVALLTQQFVRVKAKADRIGYTE